jgi:hypothetical protein
LPRKRTRQAGNKELRQHLAGLILSLREGDRLPRTRDLAALYGTSVGSISNALESLEAVGAVGIETRGRLGAFLRDRSVGLLWTAAADSPMVLGLTLASNPRYEGMATALKQGLRRAGIEAYLVFIRGSRTRLAALREGRCHAVVMSCFAADELCGQGESILFRLPVGSFASGNAVFYRKGRTEARGPLRVAIDRDSYDQTRMTELEFSGREVELRPTILPQMLRLLSMGQVDAAVVTADDMQAHLKEGILEAPLSPSVRSFLDERDTSAAIVIRSSDRDVMGSLQAAINVDEMMGIQQAVVDGRRVAEY